MNTLIRGYEAWDADTGATVVPFTESLGECWRGIKAHFELYSANVAISRCLCECKVDADGEAWDVEGYDTAEHIATVCNIEDWKVESYKHLTTV